MEAVIRQFIAYYGHFPSFDELLNGPSTVPPQGVVPNFVDPKDLSPQVDALIVITLTVATLAIMMRMWTKIVVLRKVELEDYVLLTGYGLMVGYQAVMIITSRLGLHHLWDIRLRDLPDYLYRVRLAGIIHGFVITFIKAAIFLQFLRTFRPTSKKQFMYWGCHSMIWLNLVFYFICSFIAIFNCNPISKSWNVFTPGTCFDFYAVYVASGVINLVSDIAIFVIPQQSIWKLKLSVRKKIGISAIFAIGLIACVASSMRLYYAVELRRTHDITWDGVLMAQWVLPEMMCGILAATLPYSPRFFQGVRDSKIGSTIKSRFGRSPRSPPDSEYQCYKPGHTSWSSRRQNPGKPSPYSVVLNNLKSNVPDEKARSRESLPTPRVPPHTLKSIPSDIHVECTITTTFAPREIDVV